MEGREHGPMSGIVQPNYILRRYRMRNIGVIHLVMIGILVVACGSSGSEPTESELQERAEVFATVLRNEK